MSESALRDGLAKLVEEWRQEARATNCDAEEHYLYRASEIEDLLEKTLPGVPLSSFTGTITYKLDEAEAREAHAKLTEILSKPEPFPASTEEPTVDSSGWIELAYLPGTPHMAEYYADTKEFFFAQSEIAVPGKVARHWMIPKPSIEGATHA